MQPALPPVQPLRVQPQVDRVGARLGGDRQEAVVVFAPAERAGPVAGGERGRLVEEEELGELPGLEELGAVPALELEPAGDPATGRLQAPDPPSVVVEAAAVPVDEPTLRRGDQL